MQNKPNLPGTRRTNKANLPGRPCKTKPIANGRLAGTEEHVAKQSQFAGAGSMEQRTCRAKQTQFPGSVRRELRIWLCETNPIRRRPVAPNKANLPGLLCKTKPIAGGLSC